MEDERLLYIPNERRDGDQVGPRATFERLAGDGHLAAYEAFSIRPEIGRRGSEQEAFAALEAVLRRLEPSLVLWQHPGSHAISTNALRAARELPSAPVIGYHEGDVYGFVRKRLPRGARQLARAADVTFSVGLGSAARVLRANGARRVIYTPSSVDTVRFGRHSPPSHDREYDVVMIGNRVTSRYPGVRLPGSARREALAVALTSAFGHRFALYGQDWQDLSSWKGPLEFGEQESAIQRAWISIGWNHFDKVPYYFSNRLPIALMSGVAHMSNRQPGYNELFRDGEHIFLVDTVESAIRELKRLLGGDPALLVEVGRRGRAHALSYLTSDKVYRDVLGQMVNART